MPRYKEADYGQGQLIPIRFEHQILPGSFEHALNYVVDHKLDMTAFDALRRNDGGGAPAYAPRVMLKIILCAYSRGLLSSREMASACEQNVVMMALSANSRPHYTTIAMFIRELGGTIQKLFVEVLMYCDELGLIGEELFAIDGCKITSNASKEWSGTRADFERKRTKFGESIERLIKKHRAMDESGEGEPIPGMRKREESAIEKMREKMAKIEGWLKENPEDRKGVKGEAVKSSMTDPDSAKLATGHGVIQGYNGVAAVDGKHQVIVGAEAFGSGHEAKQLEPMVQQVEENLESIGHEKVYEKAKVTADSGFHTEESLKMLADKGIDGYVPDRLFRKRDPAFETAARHREKGKAMPGRKTYERKYFGPDDFQFNERGKLVCPAGEEM